MGRRGGEGGGGKSGTVQGVMRGRVHGGGAGGVGGGGGGGGGGGANESSGEWAGIGDEQSATEEFADGELSLPQLRLPTTTRSSIVGYKQTTHGHGLLLLFRARQIGGRRKTELLYARINDSFFPLSSSLAVSAPGRSRTGLMHRKPGIRRSIMHCCRLALHESRGSP